MPPDFKSHKIQLDPDSEDYFYVRLQPKMNNFQRWRIKKGIPEDNEFWYIVHHNLKQYLSSNHMFSIIFSFIHSSRGSELIVLASVLHRNPFFLSLLVDLGGIDLLKDMIVEKQLQGNMDPHYLLYLFNVACNEPISTKIEPQPQEDHKIEESKTELGIKDAPKIIPKFNETLMDFLDILILIAKKSKKKDPVVYKI